MAADAVQTRGLSALPRALLASFLPEAWREALGFPEWHRDALRWVTGMGALAQVLGCGVFWVVQVLAIYASLSSGAPDEGQPGLQVSKAVYFMAAVLSPVPVVLFYFAAEGGIRLSAAVMGQGLGTFPLWVVDRMVRLVLGIRAQRTERDLAPDRLVPGPTPGTFLFETARPTGWSETITLELEGGFFCVAQATLHDERERPHHYLLEPIPAGWLIRRIERLG